ncbi:unnamed protein product, partial [Iphiclides podalirius]
MPNVPPEARYCQCGVARSDIIPGGAAPGACTGGAVTLSSISIGFIDKRCPIRSEWKLADSACNESGRRESGAQI